MKSFGRPGLVHTINTLRYECSYLEPPHESRTRANHSRRLTRFLSTNCKHRDYQILKTSTVLRQRHKNTQKADGLPPRRNVRCSINAVTISSEDVTEIRDLLGRAGPLYVAVPPHKLQPLANQSRSVTMALNAEDASALAQDRHVLSEYERALVSSRTNQLPARNPLKLRRNYVQHLI
jgi:hypothetical protein